MDGEQRERYFHGVNVVVKGPPWMPKVEGEFDPFWSFVDADMALLQENGLNGIRWVKVRGSAGGGVRVGGQTTQQGWVNGVGT